MLYYVVSYKNGGDTFAGLHSTTEEDYAIAICNEYSKAQPNGYFDVFTESEYDHKIANTNRI